MPTISQRVRSGVKNRQKFILENSETLSIKQCRRLLEKDLELDPKALDEPTLKTLVSKLLDEILEGGHTPKSILKSCTNTLSGQQDSPSSKRSKSKAANEPPAKKSKASRDQKPSKRASTSSKQKGQTSGNGKAKLGTSNRAVELKSVLAKCTIKISPGLYKAADEDEFIAKLEGLLEAQGMGRRPTQSDISRCKARLTKERELDGIDLNNLIETGTRPRTQVVYSEPASDDEDEDDDSEDDNVGGGKKRKAAQQGKGEESDGEESDGDNNNADDNDDEDSVEEQDDASDDDDDGDDSGSEDEAEAESDDDADDAPESDSDVEEMKRSKGSGKKRRKVVVSDVSSDDDSV